MGKFAYKTRFVMPLIFVAAIVLAFPLSQKCPYAYGESSLETPVLNETQIAQNMIDDTFTSTNMLALMVPAGDYEKEAAILEELSAYEEVDSAIVVANRYQELKSQMSHRDAIIETMNFAFPTIITSGTILAAAGTR